MKETVAFFLPTRKGSERVKNKNTRPFGNISDGLVGNKLRQLLKTRHIDEIIFSSNDERCIQIAEQYSDSRLRIIPRPEELCLCTTNLQDLIKYVPTVTDADHIVWGHVTTPLVNENIYDAAIETYFKELNNHHDSLISVKEIKNFLLTENAKLINNSTSIPWPRTQDLSPIYEINHAMFIAKRDVYIKYQDRIGHNPYLYLMDGLHSQDVDWEEDFILAELIYNHLSKN